MFQTVPNKDAATNQAFLTARGFVMNNDVNFQMVCDTCGCSESRLKIPNRPLDQPSFIVAIAATHEERSEH
jgi:hypothetical protein